MAEAVIYSYKLSSEAVRCVTSQSYVPPILLELSKLVPVAHTTYIISFKTLMSFSSFCFAQTKSISISHSGNFTETFQLLSEDSTSYSIDVTLPYNYQVGESYPVLYYLDAWWLDELIKGSYKIANRSKKVASVILVGIYREGNEDAWHRQRNYDLTPTPFGQKESKITMMMGTQIVNHENTGGASGLLTFMEDRLSPALKRSYSIDASQSTLLGHSLGGLFGMYAFLQASPIINNYLLISPALWWDGQNALNQLDSAKLNELKGKRLFVSYGGNENRLIQEPSKALLDKLKPSDIDHQALIYADANHNSVLPRAIYDGIEWLYRAEQ
jgi:predicted alpha/beta superfamily hydrolase